MAYWADKVALALDDSLDRLQGYTAERDAVAGLYRRALRASMPLSADEVRARLGGIAQPGALPSPEHARAPGWLLPFSRRFANHREAREWAARRVAGVTTVAVDGSELRPSRDYSIPFGFVQVAWLRNPHCDGDDDHYEKDVALEVVLPAPDGEDVSLRRFKAECEALIGQMRAVSGLEPPPVVYFDGTLVVSFVSEMNRDLGDKYIAAIVDLIEASERFRVPLVGYIDASDAKDLLVLSAHLQGLATPRGVNDAGVLGPELAWGDRTKAFLCARDDQVLTRYRDHAGGAAPEVCFTYLKTTAAGPPARLDVPAWVARDGLLDHVVDVTRCEVIATAAGYPYAIEAADAAAVLRAADRERLLRAAQRFCEHHGLELRVATKAASKRRRRA